MAAKAMKAAVKVVGGWGDKAVEGERETKGSLPDGDVSFDMAGNPSLDPERKKKGQEITRSRGRCQKRLVRA